MDFTVNEGRIYKRASPLFQAGYRIPDLLTFAEWFRANDWRGKKGESPTPELVQQHIRQAVEVNSHKYFSGNRSHIIQT